MSPEMRDRWQGDEIDLLEYWRALKKRGWLILALVLVSMLAAGSYTYFRMPKIFESRATILTPKEAGGGGGGLAALLVSSSAGQFLGGLNTGGGTNRDILVAILKSRTLAQELADRFRLKEYYGAKYDEDVIRGLQGATDISVSKEGAVVSIVVEDRDPKLAADIANAYVTHLDRLFAKLGTSDASRQRAFIADRLEKTEKSLRQAEESLRRFQEKNKAIVIQEQAKSALDESARVKGQLVAAEVQLEVMRSFATESNPQVIAQKRQIEELKRQLSQTQYGRGMDLPHESAQGGQPRREFHLPFTQVPELGMELVRLTREVKIQETVFTLLTQQFEQAKISEAKDVPTVQLLDKAVPAERKSRPSTTTNMEIAGAVSFILSVFLAFFLEYLERIRQREPAAVTKD